MNKEHQVHLLEMAVTGLFGVMLENVPEAKEDLQALYTAWQEAKEAAGLDNIFED